MLQRMVYTALVAAFTCGLAVSPAASASFDVAIFHTERDALVETFKFWSPRSTSGRRDASSSSRAIRAR